MTREQSLQIIRDAFSHVDVRRIAVEYDPEVEEDVARVCVRDDQFEAALGEDGLYARGVAIKAGLAIEVVLASDCGTSGGWHGVTAMGVEKALYLVMRIGIAGARLLVVLATLSSHFLTPGLYYDEAPGPPPLREQMPAILSGVGIGILLMIPHRWTCHAWLFWPRLALYALIAVFCLWRATEGVVAGVGGGKSWHIFPASVVIGCIGVALPLCLLWSRRLRRAG